MSSAYRSIIAKMFCIFVAGVMLLVSPLARAENQKPVLCRDDAMIVF